MGRLVSPRERDEGAGGDETACLDRFDIDTLVPTFLRGNEKTTM